MVESCSKSHNIEKNTVLSEKLVCFMSLEFIFKHLKLSSFFTQASYH